MYKNNTILMVFAGGVAIVIVGIIFMMNGSTRSNIGRQSNFPNPTVQITQDTQNTQRAQTYTSQDVAKHNIRSDCWSIISSKVYDLTSFVGQHPGGPVQIEQICGVDGTSVFIGQHAGQNRPNNELSSLYIGELSK